MKTVKYRLDFSAHYSIVVEVPEGECSEDMAIEVADNYMTSNGVIADWELDDGGVEEAEDDDEPVNNVGLLI